MKRGGKCLGWAIRWWDGSFYVWKQSKTPVVYKTREEARSDLRDLKIHPLYQRASIVRVKVVLA